MSKQYKRQAARKCHRCGIPRYFLYPDINEQRIMNRIVNIINRQSAGTYKYKRHMCRETTLSAYAMWKRKFDEENIEDSEFSIKCILSHILNVEFKTISVTDEYNLSDHQKEQFDRLCECRLARMPIQYIIGNWDFCRINLRMMPPVFIPRPETEQLVDLVLQRTPVSCEKILEVGCGTGAISCALLCELPEIHVVALDSSQLACQLTKYNAQQTGVEKRLTIIQHKVKEDAILPSEINESKFDVIVSNPPYIKSRDIMNLDAEIKLYEDLRALDGGPDGLRIIRILCLMAERNLKAGCKLWLEVDSSQISVIEQTLLKRFPNTLKLMSSFKDMYKRDRFVEIERT